MEKEILGVPYKELDKFSEEQGGGIRNSMVHNLVIRTVEILKKRFSLFTHTIRLGKILVEEQVNVISPELQAMLPYDPYFMIGDVVWHYDKDQYEPSAGPAVVIGRKGSDNGDTMLRELKNSIYVVKKMPMVDILGVHETGWMDTRLLHRDDLEKKVPLMNMQHIGPQLWALRMNHYAENTYQNNEISVVTAAVLRMAFLKEISGVSVDSSDVAVKDDEKEKDVDVGAKSIL